MMYICNAADRANSVHTGFWILKSLSRVCCKHVHFPVPRRCVSPAFVCLVFLIVCRHLIILLPFSGTVHSTPRAAYLQHQHMSSSDLYSARTLFVSKICVLLVFLCVMMNNNYPYQLNFCNNSSKICKKHLLWIIIYTIHISNKYIYPHQVLNNNMRK